MTETMRMGGLASGMDTDSIVKQLMAVERQPLDKVEKQKQTTEWKIEDYREVNTELLKFYNGLADMRYTTSYRSKSAESSDSSKVAVSAAPGASVGSTTITSVDKLATAAVFTSAGTSFQGQASKDIDLSSFVGKSLTVNGVAVTVADGETLETFVSKVNKSTAGATMFYDSATGQFSLSNNSTGAGNVTLTAADGDHTLASAFGFTDAGGNTLSGATDKAGQDAVLTINGITTTRSTNKFTENGVTYTLNSTFTDSSPVTMTVTNNTDDVFNNIKAFVDSYNALVDAFQGRLNEKRDKEYNPLTDAEREELTDKQVEKWEEKAQAGLLRNDPTLKSVLSDMRSVLYNAVGNSGSFTHLTQLGISTTSNWLDGGKLEINEAKLKAALEKDPDSVEAVFRGEGTAANGITNQLYAVVKKGMDKISTKAGSASSASNQTFSLGKDLDDMNKKINDWQKRLKEIEDRYWSQFTRMERSINEWNNKYNSISSLFSY